MIMENLTQAAMNECFGMEGTKEIEVDHRRVRRNPSSVRQGCFCAEHTPVTASTRTAVKGHIPGLYPQALG
jgi:hypothetical protein